MGCQWRLLPREFPPRYSGAAETTVSGSDLDDLAHMDVRAQAGKEALPSAGVIDSQSVKTTEAGSMRGYNAGKKINGHERHPVTETLGLPLSLAVHPASIEDRDGLPLPAGGSNGNYRGSPACFADGAAIRAPSPPASPQMPDSGGRSSSGRPRPKASGHPTTLGDREDFRLGWTQPPLRQGFRAADRYLDRHGRRRHHPAPPKETGKSLIFDPNFSDGL
jgi:hypothetical protein